MWEILWVWGETFLRWLHVIAAIGWIGSSFYFIHLDYSLQQRQGLPEQAYGEAWQVHGGGFYNMVKYLVAPARMPDDLTWFKWEAYATWISGFALIVAIYYAGASVLLVARGEERLRKVAEELEKRAGNAPARVHAIRGDVSKVEDCKAVVEHAKALFGEITILVNNAGVYGPMGPIEEVDWESWIEAIQINLFGLVQMCREVIPGMRGRRYGPGKSMAANGPVPPVPPTG